MCRIERHIHPRVTPAVSPNSLPAPAVKPDPASHQVASNITTVDIVSGRRESWRSPSRLGQMQATSTQLISSILDDKHAESVTMSWQLPLRATTAAPRRQRCVSQERSGSTPIHLGPETSQDVRRNIFVLLHDVVGGWPSNTAISTRTRSPLSTCRSVPTAASNPRRVDAERPVCHRPDGPKGGTGQ